MGHRLRKMCVFNRIESAYGAWSNGNRYKNIPLRHILEDIVFRKSEDSLFIQMIDFCAYALFRNECHLASKAKYHIETAFDELHGICIPQCFAGDHRKLGIIRDT
jgi:hypothetical protein